MKKLILVILTLVLFGCGNSQNEKSDSAKQNFDQMLKTSNQKVTGKLDAHPLDSSF